MIRRTLPRQRALRPEVGSYPTLNSLLSLPRSTEAALKSWVRIPWGRSLSNIHAAPLARKGAMRIKGVSFFTSGVRAQGRDNRLPDAEAGEDRIDNAAASA